MSLCFVSVLGYFVTGKVHTIGYNDQVKMVVLLVLQHSVFIKKIILTMTAI